MKRKHLLFVGAIIAVIALFGFGKTDAKADQEMVTEWFSEPHPEYFVFADCVEETSGGENATHYVYERYLWHDGKTWRATSKRLVPSDYTLNKYITSRDYGGVGKNTKKYNLWLSIEYDYPVQEESGGGYNVVSESGEQFHAWSFYTVTSGSAPTQYRYRFSRTHNEYITNLNGYYRITTVPGKSFDVAGWGTESGTNLIIWDDIPPQANQTFLFSLQSDGSYIISDQNSGLCMDVDGDTVDGANICMKTYTGGTSQRWYIGSNSDGTYTFTSALFKVYVADITWGADNENGSSVWLWLWHGGQNQRFRIEAVDVVDDPINVEHPIDNKNDVVSYMSNLVDGFELKNLNSGRMLNLYHGKTKDGSKFDTYPRDYTNTQLFWLISSDKGVQLKNACSADKRIDVKTNGSGTPKEGDAVCLYTPTSDDCSYWKINYCGQDDSGIYINIESAKTPGLYIGHPSNDLKGEKRNGLVLCTDGSADRCLWYIVHNEKPENGRQLFVDRIKEENKNYGGKVVTENRPQYMYGDWCARFIWTMAMEVGCGYAIPANYDGAKNLPYAIKDNCGGKMWSWRDIADQNYIPQAGDIIVYGQSSDRSGKGMNYQHVGVLIEYEYNQKTGKRSFKTIEGNTTVNGGLGIGSKTRNVKKEDKKTGYTLTTTDKKGETVYWFVRYIVEPNY